MESLSSNLKVPLTVSSFGRELNARAVRPSAFSPLLPPSGQGEMLVVIELPFKSMRILKR